MESQTVLQQLPGKSPIQQNVNTDIEAWEPLTVVEPIRNSTLETNIARRFSKDEIPEDIMRKTRCGIGSFQPGILQVFARIGLFVGIYSCSGLLTQTLNTYLNSQIPMIEKEFGFSSAESGFLMSCNDIGFLVLVVFVGYLAGRVTFGTFLFGMCGMICALPHFLQDPRLFDLEPGSIKSTNQTLSIRARLPMCSNTTGGLTQSEYDAESGTGRKIAVSTQMHIKTAAFVLISIGMMIQGAGKSIRSPFVAVYLDDAVDKRKTGLYMSFITSSGIFGPAIGYVLGGVFSKMYVTLKSSRKLSKSADIGEVDAMPNALGMDYLKFAASLKTHCVCRIPYSTSANALGVEIGTRYPRWIGAWWLGFLLLGASSVLFGVPIMCFPRYIKSKTTRPDLLRLANDREKAHATVNRISIIETITKEGRDFGKTICRLVRNFPYIMITLTSAIAVISLTGHNSFKPKYLASQFSLPVWVASSIMAITSVAVVGVGAILSGIMTRRFQMTPLFTMKLLFILFIITTLCKSIGFFMGCQQPILVGDNGLSSGSTLYERIDSCVENCACSDKTYFPVCGEDDRSYFSPCHAGCSVASATEFHNCTCITGSGHAVAGLCDQGCKSNLIVYSIIWSIGSLATALKIVPVWLAKIRSVEKRDRGVALALSGFIMSTIGWMPGPIIAGAIIDRTCTLWKYTCGQRQSCYLYDNKDFRNYYHALNFVISIIASAMIATIYVYFRVTGQQEWASDRIDKTEYENEDVKICQPNDKDVSRDLEKHQFELNAML